MPLSLGVRTVNVVGVQSEVHWEVYSPPPNKAGHHASNGGQQDSSLTTCTVDKDLHELVDNIKKCGYFDESPGAGKPGVEQEGEEEEPAPEDEADEAGELEEDSSAHFAQVRKPTQAVTLLSRKVSGSLWKILYMAEIASQFCNLLNNTSSNSKLCEGTGLPIHSMEYVHIMYKHCTL